MQGYSVEYPNFLAKNFIHIVYIYVYVLKNSLYIYIFADSLEEARVFYTSKGWQSTTLR